MLADTLGIDFFGIGQHHCADFAVSSPQVVLAAIAERTSRVHLGSAVTVLSSDDPIRVFQRFATLDAWQTGAPKLFQAADRLPSPSLCSVTNSAGMRRSLKKNSVYSRR